MRGSNLLVRASWYEVVERQWLQRSLSLQPGAVADVDESAAFGRFPFQDPADELQTRLTQVTGR